MKELFVYLLAFLPANLILAQNAPCEAYCWAAGGLSIRETPSGKAAPIGKVAYKGKVTVLDTLEDATFTDTMNQSVLIRGNWVKIKQGAVTGYVFDGYLSMIPPQTFYQYFSDIAPVKQRLETSGSHPFDRTTYMRKDQSYYSYDAHDGCWDHTYYLKGATLNDALMLISTSEPHEPADCPFTYVKTEGNKYYFSDCAATRNRMLEIAKDGIIYYTEDCD